MEWEPDDTNQHWSLRIMQKILVIRTTWVDLEHVILREVSQRRRNIQRHPFYEESKKNTFEAVLMRWIKLEPIIQSEVSQKEKHQYSILTHIYGI